MNLFICLIDRSAELDKLLPESLHIGLPSVDGGHGTLRGLDQGKVWLNVNWDTRIGRVPPSMVLPRDRFKGSRKKGGGKSKGQGFRVIVTVGHRVFVSLHIGGPEPGEIILINVPATQRSYYFGTRGDKIRG